MLREKTVLLFEEEEFEELTDYYLEQGDMGKALKAIQLGKSQYPFATALHIKEASILLMEGKLDEAAEAIEKAEAFSTQQSRYLICCGLNLIPSRRMKKACKKISDAHWMPPTTKPMYFLVWR
jgi:tetratricopeptide (TPR) repeat protein